MLFKTIERKDPETGEWVRFEFEALKCRDVFRVVDGLGAGENPGPWVCLSDAVAIPGEPENFGITAVPQYCSASPRDT